MRVLSRAITGTMQPLHGMVHAPLQAAHSCTCSGVCTYHGAGEQMRSKPLAEAQRAHGFSPTSSDSRDCRRKASAGSVYRQVLVQDMQDDEEIDAERATDIEKS